MRRFLDRLYAASGALAAVCLAGIAAVMLAQAGMRAAGWLFAGADDFVAWLCAASAFFAMGYTFRAGEMVRVSLLVERLPAAARRPAEILSLALAFVVSAYVAWAAVGFVYESWQMDEVAQGLIKAPVWIPQMSLVIGSVILAIAVLDDLVAALRGRTPGYRASEEARQVKKEFSEAL